MICFSEKHVRSVCTQYVQVMPELWRAFQEETSSHTRIKKTLFFPLTFLPVLPLIHLGCFGVSSGDIGCRDSCVTHPRLPSLACGDQSIRLANATAQPRRTPLMFTSRVVMSTSLLSSVSSFLLHTSFCTVIRFSGVVRSAENSTKVLWVILSNRVIIPGKGHSDVFFWAGADISAADISWIWHQNRVMEHYRQALVRASDKLPVGSSSWVSQYLEPSAAPTWQNWQ